MRFLFLLVNVVFASFLLLGLLVGAAFGQSPSVSSSQPSYAPANPCGGYTYCGGAALWLNSDGSYSWTKPAANWGVSDCRSGSIPSPFEYVDVGNFFDSFDPVNNKFSLTIPVSNAVGIWVNCVVDDTSSYHNMFVTYPGPSGFNTGIDLANITFPYTDGKINLLQFNTLDPTNYYIMPNFIGLYDSNFYLLKWVLFNSDGSITGGARTLLGSDLTAWEACSGATCSGGDGGKSSPNYQEIAADVPANQSVLVKGTASQDSGGEWVVTFQPPGSDTTQTGGTGTGGTGTGGTGTGGTGTGGTGTGGTGTGGTGTGGTGTGGTGTVGTGSGGISSTPLPGFSSTDCKGTNNCNKVVQPLPAAPAVSQPVLEATPAAGDMLSSAKTLMPSLQGFVVPQHTGTCPTVDFAVLGKTVTLAAHCTLADGFRVQLGAIMFLVWILIGVMIVVKA